MILNSTRSGTVVVSPDLWCPTYPLTIFIHAVQVEAAIAVQMMLSSKGEGARQYLEPQIREITLELLKIIRETENDDLTSVMQKIVCTYTDQLVPVAVDICQHLVGTFAQVVGTVLLDTGTHSNLAFIYIKNTYSVR